MKTKLRIDDVRFVWASRKLQDRGLLGFVSFTVNGRLGLDGLTLRRTEEGRLTLSYPGRRTQAGNHFGYIHPLDDAARLEIEARVFEALGLGEEARAS